MTTVEFILLIIAYTVLVVTIFLEVLCYIRNIENIQTIAFTVSLLLLIVALSVSAVWEGSKADTTPTNVFTLLAMNLVALTTPLNVLEERQHTIKPIWKTFLYAFFASLFVTTVLGHFIGIQYYLQYVVAAAMGVSVLLSMALIMKTKPQKRIAHREKVERLFSGAFMVLIPLSLGANYVFENVWFIPLKFGFTIPLVFILLAGSKLMDDIQRLSIINPKMEPKDQHFLNFSLTEREKQMALLLLQGKSYKEISEELYISLPTVKTHASNIYKKCGVTSRHELTVLLTN